MTDSDSDRALSIGAQRILIGQEALRTALPTGYVHDPALTVLLQLFVSYAAGLTSTLRSVCDGVPTVSLAVLTRWLKAIDDGFVITAGLNIIGNKRSVALRALASKKSGQ